MAQEPKVRSPKGTAMAELAAVDGIDSSVAWAQSRRVAPAVHGLVSGGQSVPKQRVIPWPR
jgi:hypothetical protein